MNYSIVIPVFNKAALTRHCLQTLRPTLEGAGEGEIIVIDNASSDETPQMLEEFPWVRVVRNERNLGFAGANNQGARLARGEFLVLLNNDTEAKPGWLAAMLAAAADPAVGAVGARLLFPDGTLQHAGVVSYGNRFGTEAFTPSHDMYQYPEAFAYASESRDLQTITGACLLTPRDLYLEVGGLDERYWNGYEDIDYCLKLRSRGLRIVYQAGAVLTHFESQSGTQRFRKVAWNSQLLAQRWNGTVEYDGPMHLMVRGHNRREVRRARGKYYCDSVENPAVTIICHGSVDRTRDSEFLRMLRSNVTPIDRVVYIGGDEKGVATARAEMERRGDRCVAFVDTGCSLRAGWLDELVLQLEFCWTNGAAAYAPEAGTGGDAGLYAADARCTLISLRKYPQHHRLEYCGSIGATVADFLERGIDLRRGTRLARSEFVTLPPLEPSLANVVTSDPDRIEQRLRAVSKRSRGLVSIVMLSWNALEYTKIALESIRRWTTGPYEILIVDNGSNEETVAWLKAQEGIRVILNPVNRGYAAGNNQAIAHAGGDFVVLLNNDVTVTEGWLDGLLGAFDRVPGLGISAPRSNQIAGDQLVPDAQYTGPDGLAEFARGRALRYRGQGYLTDRAIGLCLCIDRRVIQEVGGLDERFGLGNFEDDDYSIRVRAAGYKIYVCDDVFIHHFGSRSFAANKVDYAATMRTNWTKFAAKWNLPPEYPANGYDLGPAIARGFDRGAHYFALPAVTQPMQGEDRSYGLVIAAVVRDERDWGSVGAFVKRYVNAYGLGDDTLLSIAAPSEISAATLGIRVERMLQKMHLGAEEIADVIVSDEDDIDRWVSALRGDAVYRLEACGEAAFDGLPELIERSPSALRRIAPAKGAA